MPFLKSKAGQMYRQLPRVPTTRFLSPQELTSDILFSGYRPIVCPLRDNPLFQAKVKEVEAKSKQEVAAKETAELQKQEQEEHPFMAGPNGTGGILSGGVNGTWRFNPRIPNKLLQSALWSSSAMGMEYYPEWNAVPSKVSAGLKPFQLDSDMDMRPGGVKVQDELQDDKTVDQYEQVVQEYLQQWRGK